MAQTYALKGGMQGVQRISLVRLALGLALQCGLFASFAHVGLATYLLFGVIGIAVVLNSAAVPNLSARSSVLMVVGSCFSYLVACLAAAVVTPSSGAILPPSTDPFVPAFPVPFLTPMSVPSNIALCLAVSGFAGGTLLALIFFQLFFKRFAPLAALSIGAVTTPSALAFTGERLSFEYGNAPLVHGVAWYALFAAGVAAAVALDARGVT